jgi:hypothetical protein
MWTLPAEETLESPDVGGVVLVPLMHFEGSPEPILRRCRERIDREGGAQRDNLLAVTQIFIKLRFGGQQFLDLFGGSRAMIESTLIKEIVEKTEHQTLRTAIEDLIKGRFTALPENARATLEGLNDPTRLRALILFAALCRSLDEFLERLVKETASPPARRSSRRSRKA